MFRKLTLTLAALATLGFAGLATTEASAGHKWHPHKAHHFGWGPAYWGPSYGFYGVGYGPECFMVKKHTPWGIKYRRVCH